MNTKKTISVEVKNSQLDALEDLLTAELTIAEKKKLAKKVIALWTALVTAYDAND